MGCPVTPGLPHTVPTASCEPAAVVPLRGPRPKLAYAWSSGAAPAVFEQVLGYYSRAVRCACGARPPAPAEALLGPASRLGVGTATTRRVGCRIRRSPRARSRSRRRRSLREPAPGVTVRARSAVARLTPRRRAKPRAFRSRLPARRRKSARRWHKTSADCRRGGSRSRRLELRVLRSREPVESQSASTLIAQGRLRGRPFVRAVRRRADLIRCGRGAQCLRLRRAAFRACLIVFSCAATRAESAGVAARARGGRLSSPSGLGCSECRAHRRPEARPAVARARAPTAPRRPARRPAVFAHFSTWTRRAAVLPAKGAHDVGHGLSHGRGRTTRAGQRRVQEGRVAKTCTVPPFCADALATRASAKTRGWKTRFDRAKSTIAANAHSTEIRSAGPPSPCARGAAGRGTARA